MGKEAISTMRQRSRKRSFRQLLSQVHLWSGLILCLPLVVIGLTGSALVFQDEINALTAPAPRASAVGDAKPVSAMIAAAEEAAAQSGLGKTKAAAVNLPQAAGDPAIIRLSPQRATGNGPAFGSQVFLDPVTLAVLDIRQPANGVMSILHRLHANLLIGGRDGRSLVGWLGVVMLVLGASGLVIWWPRGGRWRAALTVKWRARPLRFNRDLHGAVGIWGLVVFMIVSFSGVYLAFPQTIAAAIGTILPARDLRAQDAQLKATPTAGRQALDIDAVAALAREKRPEAKLRSIALPMRPDQPYRLIMAKPDQSEGAPMLTLYLDPWSREILADRDPAAYSTGEAIIAWQRPLHEGAGLGWVWRLLVFLSGLLPLLFSVTGITMWLLKRRNRKQAARDPKKPAAVMID